MSTRSAESRRVCGATHMNQPADRNSGCYTCHSQMYVASDAFGHDWHGDPAGGNIRCADCHAAGENRTALSAKKCDACHKDLVPTGATITIEQYMAGPYVDAMHDLCVSCHRQRVQETGARAELATCAACHTGLAPDYLQDEALQLHRWPQYNRVELPNLSLAEPGE